MRTRVSRARSRPRSRLGPGSPYGRATPRAPDRTSAFNEVPLDRRCSLDDLVAHFTLHEGERQPLARARGAGERDLRRYRASRIQYTAGSGPRPSSYDQAVTCRVATRLRCPVRSRDTSFSGACQMSFERPEERVDGLDVVGVIALELPDRSIRQPLAEDIDQSL